MNPKLLKMFLIVTRHRNFTRAATEVHLSQSSVSDQIQALESEVGTALFVRARSGLELTAAGEALKPYAEELLAIQDEAHVVVASTANDERGLLTIGALETIASSRLSPWLARFRKDQPEVDIRLQIAGSGDLIDKLERGQIDIAFCFHDGDLNDRFIRRTLTKEPLSLIAAPHGPVGCDHSFTSLSTHDFVVTEPGCVYRRMVDAAFAQAGFTPPKAAVQVGSIDAIANFVAAGAGLALVPRMAVCEALKQGKVIELRWPGTEQIATMTIIWRRRRVQPPQLRRLIAAATDQFASVRSADGHLPHAGPSLS
jgi:DNA-binding transcriptional LysR family regulator